MYDLVKKDLRKNQMFLLTWILWFPLWIGLDYLFGPQGNVLKSTPVLASILSVQGMFGMEASWNANILYASLPYTRRTILAARYVSVWIVMVAAIIFFSILVQVWAAIQGVNMVVDYKSLLQAFLVGPSMVIFIIPFIIRFGDMKGNLLGAISCLACFGLLMLFGDWIGLLENIRMVVNSFSENPMLKYGVLFSFTFVMLLAFTFLSYRVALRMFQNKDLG